MPFRLLFRPCVMYPDSVCEVLKSHLLWPRLYSLHHCSLYHFWSVWSCWLVAILDHTNPQICNIITVTPTFHYAPKKRKEKAYLTLHNIFIWNKYGHGQVSNHTTHRLWCCFEAKIRFYNIRNVSWNHRIDLEEYWNLKSQHWKVGQGSRWADIPQLLGTMMILKTVAYWSPSYLAAVVLRLCWIPDISLCRFLHITSH